MPIHSLLPLCIKLSSRWQVLGRSQGCNGNGRALYPPNRVQGERELELESAGCGRHRPSMPPFSRTDGPSISYGYFGNFKRTENSILPSADDLQDSSCEMNCFPRQEPDGNIMLKSMSQMPTYSIVFERSSTWLLLRQGLSPMELSEEIFATMSKVV
nr:uncharacterized protein CTRU02_14100 [Colletotrichum truncatum]KAF6782619.1 hypothetical protein CTRU02_14100 [Colletotrichum truncatum]